MLNAQSILISVSRIILAKSLTVLDYIWCVVIDDSMASMLVERHYTPMVTVALLYTLVQ